jgi:hypothetical protein
MISDLNNSKIPNSVKGRHPKGEKPRDGLALYAGLYIQYPISQIQRWVKNFIQRVKRHFPITFLCVVSI